MNKIRNGAIALAAASALAISGASLAHAEEVLDTPADAVVTEDVQNEEGSSSSSASSEPAESEEGEENAGSSLSSEPAEGEEGEGSSVDAEGVQDFLGVASSVYETLKPVLKFILGLFI